jgi:hypothetical protein
MPCPFCSTALTIPFELRWKQAVTPEPPPVEKPVFDPFTAAKNARADRPSTGSQFNTDAVTKTLRQAQPLAAGAVSAYALWASLRRILPGCLIALTILCALSCGAGAVALYFLRQGG